MAYKEYVWWLCSYRGFLVPATGECIVDDPLVLAWGQALTMEPQEAQARLAVLVELCPVGIFFDDPHDRCIFANQAFCQLMDMTVDEALGDGWTSRVHPEDLPGLLQARAASVAAGEPVFQAEYRFVTPSGRQGWVEEQTRPVLQADGTLLGYVGTAVDITRHKDEEMLLQRVNAELCARLSHDQAELTAQRKKVAELLVALRALLSPPEDVETLV
jgi:PAS domain S-box-containing protein